MASCEGGANDAIVSFALLAQPSIQENVPDDLSLKHGFSRTLAEVLFCSPGGQSPRRILATNYMAEPEILLVPLVKMRHSLCRVSIVVAPPYVDEIKKGAARAFDSNDAGSTPRCKWDVSGIQPAARWGTHHSKMFIIEYDRSVRVVVCSSNMISRDVLTMT